MPTRHRLPVIFLLAALIAALTATAARAGTAREPAAAAPAVSDCATLRNTIARSPAPGTASCVELTPREGRATLAAAPGCGDNKFILKRKSGCQELTGTVSLIDRQSGAVVGTVFFTFTTNIVIQDDRWTHTFTATATGAAGFIGEPTMAPEPVCGSNCRLVSWIYTSSAPLFVPGTTVRGQAVFDSTYVSPQKWYSQSRISWKFTNPVAYPRESNSLDDGPPAHRCDDVLNGYRWGCVYDLFRPTHEIGSLRYPTYARHIGLAHNFGMTKILTRTQNDALRAANRAIACPESWPRPDGKSCDEYPYASTYEGAANQSYGRTFLILGGINGGGNEFLCYVPLPKRQQGETGGYSSCMINANDNSGGGSDLGVFYLDNRVIDGDQFEVRVV